MDDDQTPPDDAHTTVTDAALGAPPKEPANVDERFSKSEVKELRQQLKVEQEQLKAEQEQLKAEQEQLKAEQEHGQQAHPGVSTGSFHPTGSHTEPTDTNTKPPDPPPDGVKWPDLVQGAASLAILLGLGLYGAVRFGHQLFCDQLAVRPEDIGLTYAASVSRAAVVLVVLAVSTGMVITGVTVLENIQMPELGKPIHFLTPIGNGLIRFGGAMILSFVALFLASLLGAESLFRIFLWVIGGYLILRGIIESIVRRWRRRRMPNQNAHPGRETRLPPDRLRWLRNRPLVVFLACLLTVAAFLASGISADMAADQIKNGEEVQASGAPGILGLHGEQVLVTGDLANDLYLSNRDIMYLGQGEGSVVLYDVGAQWPMRLPTDGVSIVNRAEFVTGEIVLRQGRAIDLDSVARDLERHVEIDMNRALTKRQDTDMFELAVRGGAIQPGTMLDPDSPVRLAIVDSNAAPTRATCAKATTSLEKPLPVAELGEGAQLCVRTDLDRWIMLRVRRIKQSPAELTLHVSDWPA